MMSHWGNPKLLLESNSNIEWMSSSAGAAAAIVTSDEILVYMTGRDSLGRSNIGRIHLHLDSFELLRIESSPVLELGEPGSFDQNGISYPCLLNVGEIVYLYYTGWIEGVQVRWYNGVGLAISEKGGDFEKVSKAPIIHRTDNDFIGFGSTFVFYKDMKFIALATRFDSWDEQGQNHRYNIRAGVSTDGRNFIWEKDPIFPFNEGEYAISKPCVINVSGIFLMWYSYRGPTYKIGLAASKDGINWKRFDNLHEIDITDENWCNEMQCYPYVIESEDVFLMFFNGNGYGRSGLGLTTMKRDAMEALIAEISKSIE